jgi:uncharacterized protein YpbB
MKNPFDKESTTEVTKSAETVQLNTNNKKEKKSRKKPNPAATTEQVQAIYQMYAKQMSVKDIAAELSLSIQQVNRKLADARKEVGKQLEEMLPTDPRRQVFLDFLESIKSRKGSRGADSIIKDAVAKHLETLMP